MTKTDTFVNQVTNVTSTLSRNYTKQLILDSTNNNRTLSVNQVVRYLNDSFFPEDLTLAANIATVKNFLLKNKLLQRVRRNNNRTDAYDVTEFLTALNRYDVRNPSRKSVVGRLINS